jgi:hypothetical protein
MPDPDDKQKPLDFSREPRLTPAWQPRTDEIWEELAEAFQNAKVWPDFQTLLETFRICELARQRGELGTYQHLELVKTALEIVDVLTPLVEKHAPKVADMHGGDLQGFLQGFALDRCHAPQDIPRPVPWLVKLVPGDRRTMTLGKRNAYWRRHSILEGAYGPERRGRPEEATLSPERRQAALDAYRMHHDAGKSETRVGRIFGPKLSWPANLSPSALRSRAQRLIDLGAQLARKEPSGTPKKPVR